MLLPAELRITLAIGYLNPQAATGTTEMGGLAV
jgi:hypothetical protein